MEVTIYDGNDISAILNDNKNITVINVARITDNTNLINILLQLNYTNIKIRTCGYLYDIYAYIFNYISRSKLREIYSKYPDQLLYYFTYSYNLHNNPNNKMCLNYRMSYIIKLVHSIIIDVSDEHLNYKNSLIKCNNFIIDNFILDDFENNMSIINTIINIIKERNEIPSPDLLFVDFELTTI